MKESNRNKKLMRKNDQIYVLMNEKVKLETVIENVERNYSTLVTEREGIMPVELDMYKVEFKNKFQKKLIPELENMTLCINKFAEAFHTPDCHHLKGHFT